jgi:hypothetical protein
MDTNVQTIYSTVNNSASNVMHNRINSTRFNYLSIVMTCCRAAHLFPLNNVLCDVEFFSYFLCVQDMSTAPLFVL